MPGTSWRSPSPRHWRLAAGIVVVAVTALAFAVVANAGHPEVSLTGSNFEIDTDANLKVDDGAPSIDWGSVAETRRGDTESGSTDESFGNGTKEDTATPSVVDGGIPPNKSDLKFFGLYQEGGSSAGFLNLYWSRVQEPSGTTNMDFEFNKKQCTRTSAGLPSSDCTANGLTPARSPGDLLIQYDLSQGGDNPLLFRSTWATTGTAADVCEASNKLPCWSKKVALTDTAVGSINTSAIPAAEADGLGDHSARTFGEAQIAMSAIFGTAPCDSFGSAYLKSRSSDSFTSALKDFVPPVAISLTNCGKIDITKVDDTGALLTGVEFTLYTDNPTVGGSRQANDTITANPVLKCTTGASGTCSILAVPFGNYWVVETAAPTGHSKAADQAVGVTPGTSTVPVTFINPRQKGSLTIHKEDDGGNVMSGIKFTLTGTSTIGGSVALDCTTGSEGNCTFSNVPVGTYTLDEAASPPLPAGYTKDPTLPKSVTITDGGTQTVNIENPRSHRVVVLVCHEGTNTLTAVNVQKGTSTPVPTSIGSVPSGLQTKGVTEAELCNLGGASFGGLGHTDTPLSVKLGAAGH